MNAGWRAPIRDGTPVEPSFDMDFAPWRRDRSNFAVIAGLAALLGAAAVAPGCDDITARSFGGNAAETGGVGGDKTPTDPDACTKLIATYDDAVAKGKSCDAGAKGPSCEKPVPAKLSGCGAACTTFVDDDSMAKMIQQQWSKAGCVPDACAVELCVNPTSASCTGSGNKGTCADSLLGI